MNINTTDRRTIVHNLPPLECTETEVISRTNRIQICFESTVYVNRIDWDVGAIFQQSIQNDLGWDKHIPFFKFLGKLADRFNRQVDDNIDILSGSRFPPGPRS